MKRHAVFIGINDYENGIPKLQCACEDAQKLLAILQPDDAELLLNKRVEDTIGAIRRQMKKLHDGDLFIFYFAGHGCEMNGVHYLLGPDSDSVLIQEKYGMMPMNVIKKLTTKPGVQRLFIFDCCRNNPWDAARTVKIDEINGKTGSRGMEMLVEESNKSQSTLIPPVILYSCAEGQCSYEDRGNRQGFFTGALLKTLGDERVNNFQSFKNLLQRNMEDLTPRLPGEQEIQWYGNPERKINLYPSWCEITQTAEQPGGPVPAKTASADLVAEAGELLKKEDTPECVEQVLDLLSQAGEYAPALNMLGEIYFNGKGIEKNPALAVQYYGRSAGLGDMMGQFWYALCCEAGWGMDSPQYETAARNFQLAADQGYARAQHAFAICCADGRGVERSEKLTFEYYQKAAGQGYHRSECSLGYCYSVGLGVEADPVQAFNWYKRAAGHGNETAMNNLGLCYEKGRGVARDLQLACEYYRQAAEKGSRDGKRNLARLTKI